MIWSREVFLDGEEVGGLFGCGVKSLFRFFCVFMVL